MNLIGFMIFKKIQWSGGNLINIFRKIFMSLQQFFILISKNIITTDIYDFPVLEQSNIQYFKFNVLNLNTLDYETVQLVGKVADQSLLSFKSIQQGQIHYIRELIYDFIKKEQIDTFKIKFIKSNFDMVDFNLDNCNQMPMKLMIINDKTQEHFFINTVL